MDAGILPVKWLSCSHTYSNRGKERGQVVGRLPWRVIVTETNSTRAEAKIKPSGYVPCSRCNVKFNRMIVASFSHSTPCHRQTLCLVIHSLVNNRRRDDALAEALKVMANSFGVRGKKQGRHGKALYHLIRRLLSQCHFGRIIG